MNAIAAVAAIAALSLAACGHEGKRLSGVDKVAPPGGADPHAMPTNPHAGMDAPKSSRPEGADPHAGMSMPAGHAPVAAAPPLAWTVPATWKAGAASGMRVAQFDVGVDASGAPVQCVVFGGIGGDDAQNLSRWIGQMGDGAKESAKTTHVDHDGLKVTRLEVRGAFTDTMRPGDTKAVSQAAMLAAIVDSPAGKFHVKLVGPASVVDPAAPAFDAFLASMKPR